jgi:hypothetical protein
VVDRFLDVIEARAGGRGLSSRCGTIAVSNRR